jgi:hypothetical protein
MDDAILIDHIFINAPKPPSDAFIFGEDIIGRKIEAVCMQRNISTQGHIIGAGMEATGACYFHKHFPLDCIA